MQKFPVEAHDAYVLVDRKTGDPSVRTGRAFMVSLDPSLLERWKKPHEEIVRIRYVVLKEDDELKATGS